MFIRKWTNSESGSCLYFSNSKNKRFSAFQTFSTYRRCFRYKKTFSLILNGDFNKKFTSLDAKLLIAQMQHIICDYCRAGF